MLGSMPRRRLRTCSRQCVSRSPSANAVDRQPEKTLTALSRGRESLLHVEGLPGAPLLVLREGHAVVRVAVALIPHVAEPGHGAALPILREEAVGPADGGVGVAVGSHRAGARVHRDLVPDGAIDDGHGRHGARAAAPRRHPGGGESQDHGEVLGPRPRHHGVHGHLLDGVLPVLAEVRGAHAPDHLVGLASRAGQHGGHALLGGEHDGEPVGPVAVEEQPLEALGGVGADEAGAGPVELGRTFFTLLERPGEPLHHLLHHGPPSDLILPVDVARAARGPSCP